MNEIETFFCYIIEKTQDEHGEGIKNKKWRRREKIATATVVVH